ncbi:MAG: S-layer homology domain-containing protein [Actinobacteria bacterium]|nr:S-layer homology domain-containing protein [Actinomycetota bacterium]
MKCARTKRSRVTTTAPFWVHALLCLGLVIGLLALGIPSSGNASAQSFLDVHEGEWFQPAVEALAEQGAITGYSDGTFRPYDPITRADFAVIMAAILHLPPQYSSPFSDVTGSDWYAGAVGALEDLGIIQGTAAGTFNPSGEVERQQAATFMIRATAYQNTIDPENGIELMTDAEEAAAWLGSFKDRWSITPAHSLSVANCFRLGIVSGYADLRFYPFVTITRAQAAGMVYAGLVMQRPARTEPPVQVAAESGYPTLVAGATGFFVGWLERRLTALSYRPGMVDGIFDERTADAVLAFQKAEGLPRTADASDRVIRELISASVPMPRKTLGGKRVEIDLTRQILLLIEGPDVTATIPVATGRAGWRTPTGSFSIERKLPYWRESRLGLLYKPAYFYGGYAIHGSYSVPAAPASHGCVRVAVTTMDWLYPLLPIGMRVDVYY